MTDPWGRCIYCTDNNCPVCATRCPRSRGGKRRRPGFDGWRRHCGWIVSAWATPAKVPVLRRGQLVLLEEEAA